MSKWVENRNSCNAQVSAEISAQGAIKDAPGALLWVLVASNNSANKQFILNDATSGTGSTKLRIRCPAKDTRMIIFDPPLDFATGIWVGTVDSTDLTIVGCYV